MVDRESTSILMDRISVNVLKVEQKVKKEKDVWIK